MAAITEAACLIESGALYTRRIGFSTPADPVFLGVKHGAFSIYFGDGPFFHFDLDGRWQRTLIDGIHYLKGLDTVVRSIDRQREGANLILKRRVLSYAEVADLDEVVRQMALDLIEKIADGSYPRIEPPHKPGIHAIDPDEARDLLEQIATWNSTAWFAHRERYLATYGPVPFVPPECMNPLHIQATRGAARATCFGPSRLDPLHVLNQEEFVKHVSNASKLIGQRVSQLRQIFLSGSETLRQPADMISWYLQTINAVFPIPDVLHRGKAADFEAGYRSVQLDGIAAFLEDFEGIILTVEDWKHFHGMNLRSVTLGIESGDPILRAQFGRTWTDADLQVLVANLHEAGIKVNIALVANAGGQHEREITASLLNSLGLKPGSIVSLLDLEELGSPIAPSPGVSTAPMKQALEGLKATGVKVVPYLLEKQWI